jgi:DinB superfamily
VEVTTEDTMSDQALREHIVKLLTWQDAHATFEAATHGVPPDLRGTKPAGLPYSPWQLLEHLRITQADILAFCRDPDYGEPTWPDDYWPAAESPADDGWDRSIDAFLADREALVELVRTADLFAAVSNGTGQTFLREFLLVADHNAYHIGELVVVRRALGNWP